MTANGPPVEDRPESAADRVRERVGSFAHEIVVAFWNADLHGPTTLAVRTQLRDAVVTLGSAFAAGADAPLRLEFGAACLRWDGQDLLGASLQAGRLVRCLAERRVRAWILDPTVDAESIGRFLELLGDPAHADAFHKDTIGRALRDRGVQGLSIELGDPPTPQSAIGDPDALESYQDLADVLQDSHVKASQGSELELDVTRGVVERTVARMASAPSDLLALAVYDDIDRFTVGHSVRVALLALEVAKATGATEDQLLLVGTAGLLHDIGKSKVPQQVLFKQGPLDADEWRAMAEHPRLGAEILLEQRDVHPSAIGAAFSHHMSPDGAGYPTPVAAFEPSGISRLIRVCDVFEALTSVRPYKREMTALEAMALMQRQAGAFDRRWLAFFFKTIGIYPIGTRVRLDSGEKALIVGHGRTCESPIARILETADSVPVRERREVAIGAPENGVVHRIAAVVRRRDGQDHEDPSSRAVAVAAAMQHACLGPGCTHDAHRP